MKMLLKTAIVVAVVAVAGGAQAAYINIDNFSDYVTPGLGDSAIATPNGWTMSPVSPVPLTYLEVDSLADHLNNVQGGSRQTTVASSNNTPGASVATLAVGGATPGFTVANAELTTNHVELLYDRNGAGLGLDVSGGEFFRTYMWSDTLGVGVPSVLSLRLWDLDSDYTVTHIWTPPGIVPIPNTFSVDFGFAQFMGGIDFANIQAIQLSYDSGISQDYRIITALEVDKVPEPLSMVMLGCLGAGMAAARKLRRKA